MAIELFDLAGKDDDRRFSPYCWRTRMALAHKQLPVKTNAWRFVEKETIAASGQKAVPVIKDGNKFISDSWEIALYLDQKYPDAPSLFHNDSVRQYAHFIKYWVERSLFPHFIRILACDIHSHLHDKDKDYFRETREKRFGTTLEKFSSTPEKSIDDLYTALAPARAILEDQPFLCGSSAGFADYILFAAFQWGRCISDKKLLETNDEVYAWRERLLDMYDGLARHSISCYEV